MLKFFRKARIQFLQKGNFQKYLLYAVGEIALVMIGILLALQVANWSQAQQDERAKEEAVSDLRQEFIANRNRFEQYIELLTKIQSTWESYLSKVTQSAYLQKENLESRPRTGSRTFAIVDNALHSILNTGKIDKIKNPQLKSALTGWNGTYAHFDELQTMHTQFSKNEFRPYERQILKTKYSDVGNSYSFQNETAINQSIRAALSDRYYQNLLLSNYSLLKLKLVPSKQVLEEMNRIISLLDQELE